MKNGTHRILRAHQLLAVEFDGLLLRAAILSRGKDAGRVEAYAESPALDFGNALGEAVQSLRTKGRRAPRQAILLTSQAMGTVLELPPDSDRTLSHERMHEMVRWEMEPYFIENENTRRIGTIMMGRGYLDRHQLQQILDEQKRRRSNPRLASAGARFGEVALALGLIGEEGAQEALKLQESADENSGVEIACGWSAPPSGDAPARQWPASGIPRKARAEYVRLFRSHGLRLHSIYPLVGCAAASLNGSARSAIVLELQYGLVGCSRVEEGQVAEQRVHLETTGSGGAQNLMELVGQGAESVWLTGRVKGLEELRQALDQVVERPCELLQSPLAEDLAGQQAACSFGGLVGAARNAWGLEGGSRVSGIPARDPRPALTGQWWFWTLATATAAVFLILGIEYRVTQGRQHRDQLAYLQDVAEDAREHQKKMQQDLKRVRKRLEEARGRLNALQGKKAFLVEALPRRDALLPVLLSALEKTAAEELILGGVREDAAGDLHLQGWGLSEKAIQRFKLQLSNEMRSHLGLEAADLSVLANDGPFRLDGYDFAFRLVSVSPVATAKELSHD